MRGGGYRMERGGQRIALYFRSCCAHLLIFGSVQFSWVCLGPDPCLYLGFTGPSHNLTYVIAIAERLTTRLQVAHLLICAAFCRPDFPHLQSVPYFNVVCKVLRPRHERNGSAFIIFNDFI